jgi:hypothetical protein
MSVGSLGSQRRKSFISGLSESTPLDLSDLERMAKIETSTKRNLEDIKVYRKEIEGFIG